MKKLKTYEVSFRTSSAGITYKEVKAKDESDVIERLKKKHYRTDIILNIREIQEEEKTND